MSDALILYRENNGIGGTKAITFMERIDRIAHISYKNYSL